MILGGCPELNAIEWRCVIIDEAHRLKNKNCKLLEGLKLMNLVSNYISLWGLILFKYSMIINRKGVSPAKKHLSSSVFSGDVSSQYAFQM